MIGAMMAFIGSCSKPEQVTPQDKPVSEDPSANPSEDPSANPSEEPSQTPEEDYVIFSVEDDDITVPAEGGNGEIAFSLETNMDNVKVEATTEADFINDLKVGESSVTFSVEENESTSERTAVIVLSCTGVEAPYEVTVIQAGAEEAEDPDHIPAVTNIWRKGQSDSWFGSVVPSIVGTEGFANDWYRNVAMDDEYIDVSASSKTLAGIFAIKITDPEDVVALDMTGIEGGTFFTNTVRTIENGDETYILSSNLTFEGQWAGPNDHQVLNLYVWKSLDAAPETILSFPLDEPVRLGDKLTVLGDWKDGKLFFKNYTSGDKADMVYIFSIKDGVVNTAPVKKRLSNIPEGWNVAGVANYYPYDETSGIMGGWNATLVYEADGDNYRALDWGATAFDPNPNHGFNFFSVKDKEYVLWVHLGESDTTINVARLEGGDILGCLNDTASYITADLIGSEGTDVGSLNGAGDAAVRVIDGVPYIAVSVPGHGFGVFNFK